MNLLFFAHIIIGFKRGQFVCVLRAVQCVLSALSAKVVVADINVNDRCAAFLPCIKGVSSSECWKILFLEIRFVEFRNILLFSTKWFQLIILTQYCKYIKVNLCEVLNRSYERNFLLQKDNKIGKIQFFEKKMVKIAFLAKIATINHHKIHKMRYHLVRKFDSLSNDTIHMYFWKQLWMLPSINYI